MICQLSSDEFHQSGSYSGAHAHFFTGASNEDEKMESDPLFLSEDAASLRSSAIRSFGKALLRVTVARPRMKSSTSALRNRQAVFCANKRSFTTRDLCGNFELVLPTCSTIRPR